MMSSKVLAARGVAAVARTAASKPSFQKVPPTSRAMYTATSAVRTAGKPMGSLALTVGAVATGATLLTVSLANNNNKKTCCEMPVIMAGDAVKEADTGIMFPPMVNGFTFMGCGVRIKYVFVKVYAVGAYLRPEDVKGLNKDDDDAIEKALLDPNNHKVIRIVMNRSMTMDKYNDAIVEALKPRMGGQDMDKLDEFKALNPSGNLEKGSELLMTIRGDTLLYKNAMGNVGTIHSSTFCKAMSDVYFGSDPVSPPAKKMVIDAIKKL